MKVLFLFPHFILPGGAAQVTLKLARALQEAGHTAVIACADISEDFKKSNRDLTFLRLNIPTSNRFLYWALFPWWQLKINGKLSEYRNYILFPQVLPSNWWAWLYKKTHRDASIVWYCHEPSAFIHSPAWIDSIKSSFMRWGALLFNPVLKKIDINLERQNDFVIANSNFTATEYLRCYNRKADAVIYPPLSIKQVVDDKRRKKQILTIGRLTKFKNVSLLLNKFADFVKKFPDYSLVIAGEGEEKDSLVSLSGHLNVASRVTFAGKVSDAEAEQLYQESKVTVLCSQNEPFGLVPIESMMFGTPVIAHQSGGPLETVSPETTGFLYDTSDALLSFLERMAVMKDAEYCEMQKACRLKVIQYDISVAGRKFEEFLGKYSN